MARMTKPEIEKRIEEFNALENTAATLCNQAIEALHLTKTQRERIINNSTNLHAYITEEMRKAEEFVEKAPEPSKTAILAKLKEELSEDELRELAEQKGISL